MRDLELGAEEAKNTRERSELVRTGLMEELGEVSGWRSESTTARCGVS